MLTPLPIRRSPGAARPVAFALLIALGSCAKTPTGPPPGTSSRATVSGSARLANGSPATDALVSIVRKLVPAPSPGESVYADFTFVDSTGRFAFPSVPKGTFLVFAHMDDGSTFPPRDTLVAAQTVVVGSMDFPPTPVDLTLRPGGVFTGMVRDSATAAPFEAFVIMDGALLLSGSDSTGAYGLAGIPPGNWTVFAVGFVDSLHALRGRVAGTMPTPVRTVALPDIRLGTAPVSSSQVNLNELARLRAERAAMLTRLRRPHWRRERGSQTKP